MGVVSMNIGHVVCPLCMLWAELGVDTCMVMVYDMGTLEWGGQHHE
jgi:hypothetical protein